MNDKPNKSKLVPIAILIVIIAIIAIGIYISRSQAPAWTSYHEKTYGFDVSYPATWQIQDSMTKEGCCLFVVNVHIATTTATNASGTPIVSVTATEPVKIQLGHYYRPSTFDPFKMATNTPVTLGKNSAYTGVSNGTPFYLIPTSALDGIGAAYFTALDNTDTVGTRAIVEKVLSTISFTGTTTDSTETKTGTSTASSTAR